jgi:hypothetical protein
VLAPLVGSYYGLTRAKGSVFSALMNPTAKQETKLEVTGALEASDRAILKILLKHAGKGNEAFDPKTEWSIPMSVLPGSHSRQEDRDRLGNSLSRIMSVKVNTAT